ncbi:MAG: DUF465 domain-containing protein [Rickettsiales bacterium]|nr:DUF465 domain-containing protein [Rickettsiales bacterium]
MFGEPHDLHHEFPEYEEKIHELKQSDNHFRKLFDDYHTVNKEVIRIEQGVDNTSDEYAEDCKKKRLKLKDELFGILKSA